MHAWGVCMPGVHACLGACMARGCVWLGVSMAGVVVYVARGHACWGACVVGDMHAGGHACHASPKPDTMRYGRSMSGRYASYWNAFLF